MSVSCECCFLSATSRSLVQRRPTECDESECDRGPSYRRPRSARAVGPWQNTRWQRTPQIFRVNQKKFCTKFNHWLEQLLLSILYFVENLRAVQCAVDAVAATGKAHECQVFILRPTGFDSRSENG